MGKNNLLIIYQNSTKHINTNKLESLFDIILIPMIQRVDFKDFKLKGNHLATRYNDILFTTDSKHVFFISSSELNDTVINVLLNFDGTNKDFDFFTCKKTYNLLISLSGLVTKKEVLLKVGFLGKHTFNNLYLNFLINYSLFYGMVPEYVFHKLKIARRDYKTYSYWKYYEENFYQRNPLYINIYTSIGTRMDVALTNNFIKKRIASSMKSKMSASLPEIDDFIFSNTYLNYW